MYIHVFKTNIASIEDRKGIAGVLDAHLSIHNWNIDVWDTDNILRIESQSEDTLEIINSVRNAGYHCEALED